MEHLQTAFENIAARLLEIKSARGNSQTPTNTEQIFLSPVKTFPQPARDKEKEAPAEIVIISGKGGTGKTSLSACFAQLAGKGCIDCDVDAADLHLLLEPQVRVSEDFAGSRVMNIDYDRCVGCGRCMLNCQFNAVYRRESDMWIEIDPALCEGCGTCMIVCELDAVRTRATYDGRWYHSQTRFGPMTHATLIPARENSGRLVSLLRQKAAESAAHSSGPSILDGSPGTGCPVIASITGAKAAVIVTEPTVSALADMLRVLDLTGHFNIPSAVVVNKCDINPEMTEEISRRADMHGAGVIGTLPFDKVFTQAQQEGKTILEYQPDSVMSERIKDIWIKADKLLNGKKENIQ
jgi:MinD superfamily P-loop ATPase